MQKIIIQPTENPKVMKFVADRTLIEGSLELDRTSDISELPLAQDLFNFPFITKIFITANFVAVAKEDTVEWEMVIQSLKNIIEDNLLAYPTLFLPKKKEPVQLYAEMTPNPAVMKFVGNKILLQGFLEIKNEEESHEVPLAQSLFYHFPFVKEVFINENYIAITKNESVQWHEVMIEVRENIVQYVQEGKIISHIPGKHEQSQAETFTNREYTETEEKINAILQEYVAPAVENDGGRISLIEFDQETKTAKMLLQGACSGCPSSKKKKKNGIEGVLKNFLPDVVEKVEAVNG